MVSGVSLSLTLWCVFVGIRTAPALPPGFEDETVVPINEVVDIAFSGNIMLAVAKNGYLYTFDLENADAERQLAADLTDRVCSNGERG